MTSKECEVCGEVFSPVKPWQVNCSAKCKARKSNANRKDAIREYNQKYLGSLRERFNSQRCTSRRRGVEFNLSFDEWAWFWNGHWDKRGNKPDQLAMCRNNDEGAYELGNIYLDTNRNNSKLAVELKPQNKCKTTGRFI